MLIAILICIAFELLTGSAFLANTVSPSNLNGQEFVRLQPAMAFVPSTLAVRTLRPAHFGTALGRARSRAPPRIPMDRGP